MPKQQTNGLPTDVVEGFERVEDAKDDEQRSAHHGNPVARQLLARNHNICNKEK